MAITVPIQPPGGPLGPATEHFEIERVDYLSPIAGGRVSGVTAGFPLWRGRWTLSGSLSREGSEAWRAFVSSLRGQQRAFFGYDYGRPYPLFAPNGFAGFSRAGGGAFDGSALTWSVNADRDVVTLTGLPASQSMRIGDYVMWRWTGTDIPGAGTARRALCRLVEAADISGGGVVSFSVEPPLPSLVPGDSVADLARPCCVMRYDTGESQLGEKGRLLRVSGTISGLQDLRP